MLIEIPDPEVILSVILAFIAGLGVLFGYFKIMPLIKTKTETGEISQTERLEYYERQLIDMKIRLDALEIQGIEQKTDNSNTELKQFLEKIVNTEDKSHNKEALDDNVVIEPMETISSSVVPKFEPGNLTEHVLHLITNRSMTSRDIQITLKRTREHTSRLMKKLFEEGLVQRNTNSKPYTYSITEKGKSKIEQLKANHTVA